jgi:hypothetical protein
MNQHPPTILRIKESSILTVAEFRFFKLFRLFSANPHQFNR